MQCLAILLFPNANRQSFVAVTRAGGRKYLKSSEKSHLRPRHEARRNARVESTSDSSSYVVVGLVIKRRAIDQSSAGSSYLLAEVGQQI